MSYSLVSFHFNPFKLGQVCKQYAKDRGISQAVMAARTGLSYDTVGNIYAGKVQKIPFEYVFKICVVLGIPVEVVMMLMLKDEDIDFADQVMLYNTVEDKTVPVPDAVPDLIPGPVPDSVADTAIAVAASVTPIEPSAAVDPLRGCYTPDDLHMIIDRINAAHSAHVQDLKTQFDLEREAHASHDAKLHEITMAVLGIWDKR